MQFITQHCVTADIKGSKNRTVYITRFSSSNGIFFEKQQ